MTRTETLDKDYSYPYCNDVSKYEIIFKIGQGTFGEVFKAKSSNVSQVHVEKVKYHSKKMLPQFSPKINS